MDGITLDDRGAVVSCDRCGQKNRLIYERLGDTVRCGKCQAPLTSISAPVDVQSSADFDRLISRSSLPVVVDYWAPWCGPCRMVAPEMQKVAQRHAGRLIVAKVNTEALEDLGQRFAIRSIPTFAVFVNGREAGREVGARPAADIEAFVANVVQRT